ncbi:hypothetical protein NHF46_00275 [Arthrobacter alpinus]|nr:hypothetical protein [Arthrobacter alpinus]
MDEDESFEYDVENGAEDNFAALLFGSTRGLRSERVPITYRWRDMDPAQPMPFGNTLGGGCAGSWKATT